jgi:hypothetical protein
MGYTALMIAWTEDIESGGANNNALGITTWKAKQQTRQVENWIDDWSTVTHGPAAMKDLK